MTGDDSGTDVSVHTDLSITGKVAQFGRGVLGDVSAKLLGQFVERLEADVLSGDHAPAPESTVSVPGPTHSTPAARDTTHGSPPAANGVATAAATPAAAPAPQTDGPRRIVGPEVEPVDLLATAGAPVGRRLVPVVVGAIVAFVLFRWLRRR